MNLRIIIPRHLLILMSFPFTAFIFFSFFFFFFHDSYVISITFDNFYTAVLHTSVCYPFTIVWREIALEANVSCCMVSDRK